jgi:predicted RNA binding protein YcfA (HicA-like mRNA interferase family)
MGQSQLPLASGTAHVKAFCRDGWEERKGKGKSNHHILIKPGNPATLSIPDHPQVKRTLLQKQIQRAGLTEERYLELYRA